VIVFSKSVDFVLVESKREVLDILKLVAEEKKLFYILDGLTTNKGMLETKTYLEG